MKRRTMKNFLVLLFILFYCVVVAQESTQNTPELLYKQSRICLGIEPGEVDHVKGFELLKASFEDGYKPAAYNLGVCYINGIGCKKDKHAAIEPFLVAYAYAKELNDEDTLRASAYGLADAYHSIQNLEEAFRYYKETYTLALASKDKMLIGESAIYLALFYHVGIYKPKDEAKVKGYLKKAMECNPERTKDFMKAFSIEL